MNKGTTKDFLAKFRKIAHLYQWKLDEESIRTCCIGMCPLQATYHAEKGKETSYLEAGLGLDLSLEAMREIINAADGHWWNYPTHRAREYSQDTRGELMHTITFAKEFAKEESQYAVAACS